MSLYEIIKKEMKKLIVGTSLVAILTFGGERLYSKEIRVPSEHYPTIQAGINASEGNGDEIIVAPGTYYENINFGGRNIVLRSTNPNDPDVVNSTIIDGMRNGSVVTFNRGEDPNCVLNGFTITNGFSMAGGGLYCQGSSPTVMNNIIVGNVAEYDGSGGGGIACFYGSSSQIINNIIIKNIADQGGGGIRLYNTNSPIISNNVIAENIAYWGGGITTDYSGSPIIENNIIFRNLAELGGGGIYCWSFATIKNNIIVGNETAQGGGGICFSPSNDSKVTNNTIVGNRVVHKGRVVYKGGGGVLCKYKSSPIIENCILWDNTDDNDIEIFIEGESNLTINYNNIRGYQSKIYVEDGRTFNLGPGNIDVDPCFVDAAIGDYHLKSEGWRWDSKRKVWTWDDVTSRCIDAGNPSSPLENELLSMPYDPNNEWGVNLRINMGAYGGTAEASMAPYDWALLGDLTNDGIVNLKDFAAQAKYWMKTQDKQLGDLSRNGIVNLEDLALLTEDWLGQTIWHKP